MSLGSRIRRFCLGATLAAAAACDDDAGDGDSELGPTAQIRVANVVSGQTFDVWGANQAGDPVRIAEGIAPGTVSDYFAAPLDPSVQHPVFALVPGGEPLDVETWSVLSGPDRARIDVDGVAESEQASVVVSLDEDTNQLQWETLDESHLRPAVDPTQANFNLFYGLHAVDDALYVAFAPVGSRCFLEGPANIDEVFTIPANATLGVFDIQGVSSQMGNACSALTPLASLPLDTSPGARLLIVSYLDGSTVKLLSAPITAPDK